MTKAMLRAIGSRLRAADGFTMTEMMVVLAILLVVLGGMTTLFVSASKSQIDQTNRVDAQQNARLALDSLRRELRCASGVTSVSSSSITITLPGYCQEPVTSTPASFTWCAPEAGAPYTLKRYAGSSCSGVGATKADSLASNALFSYNRASPGPVQAAPVAGASVTDGYFKPGTYAYSVTAVTAGGEISGEVEDVTITAGSPNQITLSWSAYAGALSYNVYGRDDGSNTTAGLRKLANVLAPATSYLDVGCATPAPDCAPTVVVDSSLPAPPLATVSFSLQVDVTTADGRQRFELEDDVVLRNSGRY